MARQWDHALRRSFATYRNPGFHRASTTVVKAIIGANLLVFSAWAIAQARRNIPLHRRLTESFTLSLHNLREHRYYTLLTSAFSHRDVGHIAFNMFNLWTFGQIMAFMGVSAPHTAAVCLASGLAGSAAWLYHTAYITLGRQQSTIHNTPTVRAGEYANALGASGMVMGVGATAACLAPFQPMHFMFIPVAIPLWVAVGGYFAVDAYLLNSVSSRIGHSAHIGGALMGAAYYILALRRLGGISKFMSKGFRR